LRVGHQEIAKAAESVDLTNKIEAASAENIIMLCDTCRWTERPGFIPQRSADPADSAASGTVVFIPCPECGGQTIAHCCEGLCEQPEAGGPPE
jgi:hypothetical protein